MSTEDDVLFTDPTPDRQDDGACGSDDPAVARVAKWFTDRSDRAELESRFSSVFRQSLDEVMDGQRTGRFDVNTLEKTEKTYLGTKVEIVCRAEFGFPHGVKMDYSVAGTDVDAKFSLEKKWMIPREAMGHICLLMAANDSASTFTVGLIKIRDDILTRGGNQDGKRSISQSGRGSIKWIFEQGNLRKNLLLGLDPRTRELVMAAPPGQRRVDQLFRHVHGCVVDRNAVVTSAKQLDAPKRVRDARQRLAPEGVIILGHQKESPRIARALNLPVPEKGTWVAARVVPASPTANRAQVLIEDVRYVVAEPGEERHPAPEINY
ncbi:restriction endonuclease [Streptomyces sp. p1417]|uniref:Restriction endonuclease n=1 Tax=Streptomyces typhae TaxID=2681492 RepID=A0A6L6WW57_9ACTN|nr:NaeI family type II restriction endonuclease [Streptomyces typhae]MVO84726.1 restriction endonuclease [Streptomyces typhae]